MLTQPSGNGYEEGTGKTPPYQNGRYILMFDVSVRDDGRCHFICICSY